MCVAHLKENKYVEPIAGWYCDRWTAIDGPWDAAVRAHCHEFKPLHKDITRVSPVEGKNDK